MIDIALEIVRALVLLGIVVFLWSVGRGRFELTRSGWSCIIGGFGLLLFGSLVDITDNFESLNRFVIIGDTETEAILEKFVGFLGGFVLLAIGLVRWIPSVQRLSDEIDKGKAAAAALRRAHVELETRVLERTNELRNEITERKRAEETLLASEHALQERIGDLEEAHRKLEMQGESLVRLADDLRLARDEARGADRAKSEFLAAMSHELRTPLNAVIGFSEVIKDEIFGPAGSVQYRDYAHDIHESGQHLLGLINDLLDLSKIESGATDLHEDTIEIPALIRASLKLVEQRADLDRIKLELELPDRLPALRADERKLKQILVNLLTNAIKFTNAGGEVTLRAWCPRDGGYVFQITDTGIGIAADDIPKAFSRFGQIDAYLNRQHEGTGLGLPLTKALVEQHGGNLELRSEVGVGTTVTVNFPTERIVASLAS